MLQLKPMPAERYFIDHNFQLHGFQELKGSEFHHLAHVMRTQKGELIELVNGKGTLAHAIVQEIKKDKALLKVEQLHQAPSSPCRLILAQALSKGSRLDFILEKGTELGVDRFCLFPGHHSAKKECYPSQLERAHAVTIAAMKQCGRLYLPEIILQPSIDEWENFTDRTVFFGDLEAEAPLFEKVWQSLPSPTLPLVFTTGPEGGFSLQEIEWLKEKGAFGVKLHENILRTETASLMALSLLSHWLLTQH